MVGPLGAWNGLRFTEQTSVNFLPADFINIHSALQQGDLGYRFNPRYYDLLNVKYVLTPFELPPEILARSRLQLTHHMPYSANVSPLLVYRYVVFIPNPAIIASTLNAGTQEELLRLVTSPSFNPRAEVAGIGLPEIRSPSSRGAAKLTEYGKAKISISAETDGACWLLMQEHFDKYWKARVDGKLTEVHRLNLLHFGVPLEAGKHEVEFLYRPPRTRFTVTAIAWLAAIAFVVRPGRRKA